MSAKEGPKPEYVKPFVAYYYFVGWDCLSLGFHLCLSEPNVEIHLPFGFVRIGLNTTYTGLRPKMSRRAFGYDPQI